MFDYNQYIDRNTSRSAGALEYTDNMSAEE